MANTKIDLFFQIEGFEAHIELTPSEGESGFKLLQNAATSLKRIGATPRPAPKQFGGGGRKPPEPIPTTCPTCQASIDAKPWKAGDGKEFLIHRCVTNDKHFKRFVPKAS